jgi:hypothetical protein
MFLRVVHQGGGSVAAASLYAVDSAGGLFLKFELII